MKVYQSIKDFIYYGINTHLIDEEDTIYVLNRLCELIRLDQRLYDNKLPQRAIKLDDILNSLCRHAISSNMISNNKQTIDLLKTKIMDLITPYPSTIIKNFWSLYRENCNLALTYFYDLAKNTNYLKDHESLSNITWCDTTKYGILEITINLSKPEKDPKVIASALNNDDNNLNNEDYPMCLICVENVGYGGSLFHPARDNLRILPIKLDCEQFFMQYSPYSYYREHAIVLKEEHIPMQITDKTFERLLDFVDIFPDYFIGSNASLPIIGGSILTHEHYQAGRYVFPIDKAQVDYAKRVDDVLVEHLVWPLTVIRLRSVNRKKIAYLAKQILHKWRDYENLSINILKATSVRHNDVTPIVRYINGEYIINIILRNNYCSDEYPYGIFHPDESLHHIKKENIGLIEVMGLAILPGRLHSELETILSVLSCESDESELQKMSYHIPWYNQLKGRNFTMDDLKKEVTKKFVNVLECCNVFRFAPQATIVSFLEQLW